MRFMRAFAIVCFSLLFCAFGVKTAKADSMVFMPFASGESWRCSQGPGGSYSHSGSLGHAYDFNLPAFDDNGRAIVSPVSGTVVRAVKNKDNVCGNGSGWGNYVIIKENSRGKFIRIAHMLVNSIAVNVGDTVQVGTFIGKVGCTGFSTGPHLHIQVQDSADTDRSQPLKFIEGPITCNNTAYHRSQLLSHGSVIDDSGETNLGHRLVSPSTSYYGFLGDWNTSTGVPSYLLAGYYVHQVQPVDVAYFSWSFQVASTGWYRIHANWTAHANRDPRTLYEIMPSGGGVLASSFADQTRGDGRTINFVQVLGPVYLGTRINYTVRVRGTTTNRYVAADAIMISRN